MKVAIVFGSTHHGNTKKLVDAIVANSSDEIKIIDTIKEKVVELTEYDLIGFASGIAYGKYYPTVIEFAEKNLPQGKNVFLIHTAGNPKEKYNSTMLDICQKKDCNCLGTYYCKGFDTYGPFKAMGGIAKGHPTEEEIIGAVKFYSSIRQ